MKKLLPLLILFISFFGKAQLDTDHWFAPMAARSATNSTESYLYLSTNETTPFGVQIFNNNILYQTVQISKGSPAMVAIPDYFMMATSQTELFTASSKGLYVKGPKKFFANYRFAVTNHAEIITSKGLAGLGKEFYAAMGPNVMANYYINSTIGFIATEDNTTVTVSGYDPNIDFSDGINTPTRTETLNKGQSYILDVVSTHSQYNLEGLIGSKIVSNKPISVTNGNFNGVHSPQSPGNNDILMDQAVPVERLGKDFVVVKGNGPATSGMESVLVVATENNTQISVNGTVYGTPINAGDYMLIDGSNYISHPNLHFNMNVQGNKNIYVYQLLGGTSAGTIYATGGFNYIPPLSCFLPNKVDEIGFINTIGGTSYNTKLNIITQTGAAVTVNGIAPAPSQGPYPVTGNAGWVTYSIPNISGNVTVNSTKSVTAGIAAGSGAVGYGGYFAGFSSVPAIVKTGDCYAGILLQVDNTYDAYQWFLNGVAIPGATTYFINPELYGAGVYTVNITKNNCETKLTDPYSYTLCPPVSTTTHNIGSCNTLQISPAFTVSPQPINPASVQLITNPTNGTATVNSTTGVITYSPNTGLTTDTTDQFFYYAEGTGSPATFQYFKAIINIDVLQVNNAAMSACSEANGNGIFNLTTTSVTTDAGASVTYFSDATLSASINNPNAYSAPSGIVYAKVTSAFGCTKTAQITLTVNPSANINTSNYNGTICDINLDGSVPVDFSTVTPQIVNNTTLYNVRYYLNQADATAGNNNTLAANWTFTAATTVFVRVDGLAGNCPPAFGQINFEVGSKIPLLTPEAATSICDNDLNGTENIDLNSVKPLFTADPAVTLTFHQTLANAQNGTAALPANQSVNTGGASFFIRFESANACPEVAKININLNSPSVSTTLTNVSICANTQTVLDAGPGFTAYLWSNGATTQTVTVGPGNYSVDLTSANGCVYHQNVTVTGVNPPNLNTTLFDTNLCDVNFDGNVNVNFLTVSLQIVNPIAGMNIKYYLSNADALAGNNNFLPNNWTYSVPTTVFVRVENLAPGCPPVFGQLQFGFGTKIPLITDNATASVCDPDLNGSQTVDLNTYKNLFTAAAGVTLSFHATMADAQNDVNPISPNQNVTGTNIFYVRFESADGCPNVATLTLQLKAPKKSDLLKDITICPNASVVLDAGPGFESYVWSNGSTSQTATVLVGNYWVDLGFNGCVYRQYVTVSAATAPVITGIDINGSTVTINVSGGTPPYQYCVDGSPFQNENVFVGLPKGPHTVTVISADGCIPVRKEFLILNFINAITPNGDGFNDYLDFTDLRFKENVQIEIFDRYGLKLFQSSRNSYIWDGMLRGNPIPTGTYWYMIRWTEPETKTPMSFSSWIMVKNRD